MALAVGLCLFLVFPFLLVCLNDRLGLPRVLIWPLQIAGIVLIICGAFLFAYCTRQFARVGKGTPVPVEPPKEFVAIGLYRVTRNPIYIGYFLALFGEFSILGHVLLFVYFVFWVLAIHLYVVLFEERELVERFGEKYLEYKKTVPRWIGCGCVTARRRSGVE